MLLNITIAFFMIMLTTVIHTIAMVLVFRIIRSHKGHLNSHMNTTHIPWIGVTVLLMMFASLVEVSLWAATYLMINAIDGFEKALYFSMVTFTSLGYGDVVLNESWRLLASIEAANGIVMFGWTTAVVIAVVQHLFFNEEFKK